jgi:hypothetical protein
LYIGIHLYLHLPGIYANPYSNGDSYAYAYSHTHFHAFGDANTKGSANAQISPHSTTPPIAFAYEKATPCADRKSDL